MFALLKHQTPEVFPLSGSPAQLLNWESLWFCEVIHFLEGTSSPPSPPPALLGPAFSFCVHSSWNTLPKQNGVTVSYIIKAPHLKTFRIITLRSRLPKVCKINPEVCWMSGFDKAVWVMWLPYTPLWGTVNDDGGNLTRVFHCMPPGVHAPTPGDSTNCPTMQQGLLEIWSGPIIPLLTLGSSARGEVITGSARSHLNYTGGKEAFINHKQNRYTNYVAS